MKALILDAEARTANVQDVLKPTPGPGEVLVEVHTIGLNPIDSQNVGTPRGKSGRTVGSDFAGTISSLGRDVPASSDLKIGDRVAGFLVGANSANERPGAFADFLVVPWDLVIRIPSNVSLEEAAGVSLVALTAAQGLWYRMGLEAPFEYDKEAVVSENPEWKSHHAKDKSEPDTLNVFIYGASTSVGLIAAQMVHFSAKASGKKIRLFGTASKARWDMLKSEPFSYDHLVEYRDADWPEQIVKLSNGERMHYVYDCISEGSSVQQSCSTLASNGKAAIVRSRAGKAWIAGELPVEPIYGAVWEGLGEEVFYNNAVLAKSPAARGFAVEFYRWISNVLGKELKPVPVRLMPGGLERVVPDGFELLGYSVMGDRNVTRTEEHMRPVAAEKLVYQVR